MLPTTNESWLREVRRDFDLLANLDDHAGVRVEEDTALRASKHRVGEHVSCPGRAPACRPSDVFLRKVGTPAADADELSVESLLHSGCRCEGVFVPLYGLVRELRAKLFDDAGVDEPLKSGRFFLCHEDEG